MRLAVGYAALFVVCGSAGVVAFVIADSLAERLSRKGRA